MVLPPREAFSAASTGAIGLVVQRLAAAPTGFAAAVLGPPVAAPFADAAFLPVRPSLWPARHSIRYAGGVARVLRRLRPALVEVHNRPDVALTLAGRLADVPVALFLHNDPQGMRCARTARERRDLLVRLAAVVTVSGYLRDRLLAGIAAPPPVTVLPNCLDLRAIPPSPAEREPVVLFVGRVVADKGADTFVRACARALPALPGWRAEMIGADRNGVDSPQTPFVRALRPLAAAAAVAMPGWRPHAELLAAVARAAIVVVPSRWPEPFGLTALEAMACGAALLCSPRGGLPEVVGEAAVPIDPDDADALGEAIVALARDPVRRATLGEAGRRRAAGFGVTQAAAALADLRRTILAASTGQVGLTADATI